MVFAVPQRILLICLLHFCTCAVGQTMNRITLMNIVRNFEYKFKRLPFGLKSSSEVFQQKNSEAFGGISGVHVIVGDMIIAAVDEKEHTEILHKVMDRAKELNKIQYKVTKHKILPTLVKH
ncbi:Transposon Ty3-I Gag-Pol [Labeo rohita]|uniref:Transposon Ty3-I Gag-Pol n=1 Tax=Labeo rohita TaxID=84645 RepID=A0A498NWQ1_LABRO|nr:Transposon Ty3-I Gag-Pol [Labeo rohita]